MCMALAVVGCSKKDQPTQEQVAEGMKQIYAGAYAAQGGRIELQKWDKMTYSCEPIEGAHVKQLLCTTGGKITIAGYINGVQTTEGAKEVPSDLIIKFGKTGENQWSVIDFDAKK